LKNAFDLTGPSEVGRELEKKARTERTAVAGVAKRRVKDPGYGSMAGISTTASALRYVGPNGKRR